jgi:cytochrome c oxidase cbb3-type subunit 2
MRGFVPLVLGIFGTFAFSWLGLTVIPNIQIGALNPQSDEEGTDIYPMPQSGMAQRGRHVFAANGCVYCHSTQLRPDYAANDLERDRDHAQKIAWGTRRSAPRDYIFDRPVMLGKDRMGPDLTNMGKAAPAEEEAAATAASPSPAGSPAAAGVVRTAPPSAENPAASASRAASPAKESQQAYTAAWHHRHLYAPRSINIDSTMPAYRFLYVTRPIGSEPSADALDLTGPDAPPHGWQVVPRFDARCLVAYLMALDQSHPLAEVKSAAPAPAAAVTPAASPAAKK